MKKYFDIVIVMMLAVSLGVGQQSHAKKKAEDFSLKTASGSTIQLSKLRGKVVLVNFWATWCGPCRAEIPDFSEVYKKYRAKGFEIIGISLDQDGWNSVSSFVKKYGIPYPVVLGDGKVVDQYGGFEFIPTSFLVDQQGNIVDQHTGAWSKAVLEKKLKGLL
jgi:thiol-disulfide isomerase/thioredoxin